MPLTVGIGLIRKTDVLVLSCAMIFFENKSLPVQHDADMHVCSGLVAHHFLLPLAPAISNSTVQAKRCETCTLCSQFLSGAHHHEIVGR